jgi:hypothetical protein
MEALETSINYWEDALAAFSLGARGGVSGALALTSPEEAEFCREIQDLLQNAYLLQVCYLFNIISRYIGRYHSRFIPEGIADISLKCPRFTKMRNTLNVISGKSISGVVIMN